MYLFTLFVEFMLFSFLGWVWETVFCTMKTGHWSNRGFLFGPICPIYGAGCVLARLIFMEWKGAFLQETKAWQIFLISAVGSAVLEYLTSYVLEKKYHARWWDYSGLPLNLNGRISLPTTVGFGLAGILVVRVLLPLAGEMEGYVPMLLMEILALLLMWVFGADFALTQASVSPLVQRIESLQKSFDDRAEVLVAGSPEEKERLLAELEEKVREQAEALSVRQRYLLSNMQTFRASHKRKVPSIGERLREAVKERREKERNKDV